MNAGTAIFTKAAELTRSGEAFMLLTVIEARGSAPRTAGARMIVRPTTADTDPPAPGNRPEQIGTVGGGGVEHAAIRDAIQLFADRRSSVNRYDLTPEHGAACGGTMQIFLEYVGSPLRLIVFGAGHVSAEFVHIMRDADLAVTVVDERAEWNTEERFPGARRVFSIDEGVAVAHDEPGRTLVCVVTYSHEVDYQIVRKLLPKPPTYLGMIGSKRKRDTVFTKLANDGFDQETIQAIHSPIGIGDLGKAPSLVAVSIAAEVLTEVKRLADA